MTPSRARWFIVSALVALGCNGSRSKQPANAGASITPARQAISTPSPRASVAPASSAAPSALARPFELEPVAPEPNFAIALNAEDSGAPDKDASKRFTCMTPERPNCVGGYEYWEARSHFMLAEDDSTDDNGVATVDSRAHRHPTSFIDNRGAPTCFAGKCKKESDGHSFLFEGFDRSARPRVERLELQVSQSGGPPENVLQFGEWRYLRYFIKIHPKFGLSRHDVLITQVWQRNSNSLLDVGGKVLRAAVGPAFSVNLTGAAEPPPDPRCSAPAAAASGGTVNAQFSYRNDSSSEWATQRGLGPERVVFLTCALPKDTWLGFVIAMKPAYEPRESTDPAQRGTILVWKLDTRTGLSFGPNLPVESAANYQAHDESKYRFYWGFRPERRFSSPPDPLGGFTDRFDVRVGIYRSSALYSTLWFDDIKLTNHEACLPGTERTCP